MAKEEKIKEEPVRNVTIYNVPISTIEEFKAFAKAMAWGKYSVALRLLLDRSAVIDIFSNHESRIKSLEREAHEPQSEEEKKSIKRFGGMKNE